jgi:hypothetical protein
MKILILADTNLDHCKVSLLLKLNRTDLASNEFKNCFRLDPITASFELFIITLITKDLRT